MVNYKNPWKKIKERNIYENPWIKLIEDEVINPGGGKGIYGKVSFKNRAIGIIPVDRDGNTWLVGQYRYTLDEYSWEIPMGGGPLDEDRLVSARRELKEETGITADQWTEILHIHTSNSVTDEEGFVFLAEGLHFGLPDTEETEQLTIKKTSFKSAIDLVMDGTITDSLSIAGILKVARIMGL